MNTFFYATAVFVVVITIGYVITFNELLHVLNKTVVVLHMYHPLIKFTEPCVFSSLFGYLKYTIAVY